jgi:hypothetical protein
MQKSTSRENNIPGVPVHDGHQIGKSFEETDVCYIGRPDSIRPLNNGIPQEVAIHTMLRVGFGEIRLRIDRFYPHSSREPLDPLSPHGMSHSLEGFCNLPGTAEGEFVNEMHKRCIIRVNDRFVVQARTGHTEEVRLPGN